MINAMTHEYKNSRVSLLDCIEGMKQYPDKYFTLAVCDPPYGIGFSDYQRVGGSEELKNRHTKNGKKEWDAIAPSDEYFIQLERVSLNQIIWGGNYFPQLWKNGCKGFIFWHKHQPVDNFAKGELAWSSFNKPANCFDFMYYGNINTDANRLHPTQKPIVLYDWIYDKYLPQGGKVLDTHLGSQSNRISAFKRGNIDFTAFELDSDYFRDGNARFDAFVAKYEPASEIDKTADGQFKMF